MKRVRDLTPLPVLLMTAIVLAGCTAVGSRDATTRSLAPVAAQTPITASSEPLPTLEVGLTAKSVTDPASALRYLRQEVTGFWTPQRVPITGDFEYFRIPATTVRDFQVEILQTDDETWQNVGGGDALVLVLTSSEAKFHIPRPRPGHDGDLAGDAFVLILEPQSGLKSTFIVPDTNVDVLRTGARDIFRETVVFAPTP